MLVVLVVSIVRKVAQSEWDCSLTKKKKKKLATVRVGHFSLEKRRLKTTHCNSRVFSLTEKAPTKKQSCISAVTWAQENGWRLWFRLHTWTRDHPKGIFFLVPMFRSPSLIMRIMFNWAISHGSSSHTNYTFCGDYALSESTASLGWKTEADVFLIEIAKLCKEIKLNGNRILTRNFHSRSNSKTKFWLFFLPPPPHFLKKTNST